MKVQISSNQLANEQSIIGIKADLENQIAINDSNRLKFINSDDPVINELRVTISNKEIEINNLKLKISHFQSNKRNGFFDYNETMCQGNINESLMDTFEVFYFLNKFYGSINCFFVFYLVF